MKLVSLNLRAFRQHVETSIEFHDGLTGIIGANGAGKTSLIEALAFALYGSQAVRGKVESLKTRGSKKDVEFEVSLLFEHEGAVYRVDRGAQDGALYLGGEAKPIASGNREVTARIGALLGMNYEEFSATCFTEQKGLEFLGGKRGTAERERFIVRMMGYDKLERVQELLRTDRKDKRNILSGWESSLGSREEIVARISSEDAELKLMEEKHREAETVLHQAEANAAKTKGIYERHEAARKEFLTVNQKHTDMRVRYEERSKRIKWLEGERKKLLANQAENAELSVLTSVQMVEEYLVKQQKTLAAEIARAEDLEKRILAETSAWHGAAAGLRAERDVLQRSEKELTNRLTSYSKLDAGAECPTCGQELGDSFGKVRHGCEGELAKIRELLHEQAKLLEGTTQQPETLKALHVERERLVEERRASEQALAALRSYQSILGSLQNLDRELGELRKELEQLDRELQEARAKIGELRFSEDDYLKFKNTYEASSRLMEVSRLQKVRLEGEHNLKKALLERTKKELEQHDEKLIQVGELKRQLLVFEESDKVLTEFRRYLNTALRPRLAELAGEFMSELTDGRYTTVDIGDDFTPTVLEDGEPKPVISGGEEDILNLCLRLALSHMLAERAGQSFSLLILDEVFGSLDETRRNNVLLLLERLRNRFEQILVITHMEEIKEGVQDLIYINYEEGEGRVRVAKTLDDELLASNL